MNVPNGITIIRIILTPIFVIVLGKGLGLWALIIFTAAGVTDALDGFLARAWGQRTVLGSYLDPLADKFLLVTSFISLAYYGKIPVWMTIVVLSRDLILILGSLAIYGLTKSLKIKPTVWSKITTWFQLMLIFEALVDHFWPVPPWLFAMTLALTAGFTVFSGTHYIVRGFKMIREN